LKPGDVRRAAAALVGSEELGDLWTQGRVYDVRIWGTPEVRGDVSAIKNLLIATSNGEQVPLSAVADVRIAPTPNVVSHENLSRYVEVSSNVTGRDLGSVAKEVEATVAAMEYPTGYHPEVLGEYAERQAAQTKLITWAVVAGVAIFFLLQLAFRSWKLATVPPADRRYGIRARPHPDGGEGEGGADPDDGAGYRLALLPLVVAGSIPGHEIEHPMAIVILGGLVTATLVNRFVVPFLYLRFGREPGRGEPEVSAQPQPVAADQG
jgi:Cu/Ag efflux pump CusA